MRRPCGGEVEGQGPPASPVRRDQADSCSKVLIDARSGVPANRSDICDVILFADENFDG
jgi:hypothetical protein